jgi:hypothetical protein
MVLPSIWSHPQLMRKSAQSLSVVSLLSLGLSLSSVAHARLYNRDIHIITSSYDLVDTTYIDRGRLNGVKVGDKFQVKFPDGKLATQVVVTGVFERMASVKIVDSWLLKDSQTGSFKQRPMVVALEPRQRRPAPDIRISGATAAPKAPAAAAPAAPQAAAPTAPAVAPAPAAPAGNDASGLPNSPDAGGLPAAPDASGLPTSPDASGLPAAPDAGGLPPAASPSTGLPAAPAASGLPAAPDASGLPAAPDAGGLPPAPAAPGADALPAAPDAGLPAAPAAPAAPDALPAAPDAPGAPPAGGPPPF